jgi:hypothetical protein
LISRCSFRILDDTRSPLSNIFVTLAHWSDLFWSQRSCREAVLSKSSDLWPSNITDLWSHFFNFTNYHNGIKVLILLLSVLSGHSGRAVRDMNVFGRSNSGGYGFESTTDMDVCVRSFYLCYLVCRHRPCDGLIPHPRSLLVTCRIKKLKKRLRPKNTKGKGCKTNNNNNNNNNNKNNKPVC